MHSLQMGVITHHFDQFKREIEVPLRGIRHTQGAGKMPPLKACLIVKEKFCSNKQMGSTMENRFAPQNQAHAIPGGTSVTPSPWIVTSVCLP